MRCNVGVNPYYLTDQHLIAEYRELKMVYGNLKINNFRLKTVPPSSFTLGKGHLNFFKNKLVYLDKRYDEIVKEMKNRSFQTNISFPNIWELHTSLLNNWTPSINDTILLRERIVEKIRMKPNFYRWYGDYINKDKYIKDLMESELFYV